MLNKPAQVNLSDPNVQNLIHADVLKLFLTSTNSSIKLSSLNLILVRNSIDGLLGPIEDIQFLKVVAFLSCAPLNPSFKI